MVPEYSNDSSFDPMSSLLVDALAATADSQLGSALGGGPCPLAFAAACAPAYVQLLEGTWHPHPGSQLPDFGGTSGGDAAF